MVVTLRRSVQQKLNRPVVVIQMHANLMFGSRPRGLLTACHKVEEGDQGVWTNRRARRVGQLVVPLVVDLLPSQHGQLGLNSSEFPESFPSSTSIRSLTTTETDRYRTALHTFPLSFK